MTDEDLALEPVAINFNPGPEYREKARKWQGIPGIERAPNGRLWAAWYTGGRTEDQYNHVVLVTSLDDGATWSEPVLAIDPPSDVRASDPVLWHDPNGRLWLFWMQSAHCGMTFDGRGGVWAITCNDSGSPSPAWSAPRRVANGIMMNKPTVLSTGEWLLPCAVWAHRGPWRIDLPDERHSNVIVSRDQGVTFERLGYAEVPNRGPDEHMLVERRDGSLWMLVRRQDGIGEAVSHDRGRTWGASPHVVLPGPNARFHLRRLRSGRLLLINHYGFTGRSHLTALLSDDDGATWPHRLLLDERDSVSYPDAVETSEGRLYVIYDRRRVGEGEILMQSFTEDDVLAGRRPGFESGRVRVISRVHRTDIGSQRVVFERCTLDDYRKGVEYRNVARSGIGDGPVTAAVAEGEGELHLAPLRFKGSALFVEGAVEPGGSIRVEIMDWIGLVAKAYALDACLPMHGAAGEQRVFWKDGADVSVHEGELVRLRFVLDKASLYGFRFACEAKAMPVRRLCVADDPGIGVAALRKALHAEAGYETGFMMTGAPVAPKNQTRFVVRRHGGKLVVGAMLHQCNRDDATDLGAGSARYAGGVFLTFCPRGEATAFLRIGFAEGQRLSYSGYLPYPDTRSTRQPLLRPTAWSFDHFVNAPGSIFETREVLFRAVFDERAVFALSDVVGFNVTRSDAAARETSSWAFSSGMSCDGLLLRSAEARVNEPAMPSVPPSHRFAVGLTNDPLMVMAQRPYTPASLDAEMRTLKAWGLDRYHWIDNTGYEAMLPGYPSLDGAQYRRSLAACGELLPAASAAAHRHKLMFVADVKLNDLSWLGEPGRGVGGRRKSFDGAVYMPMPDLEGRDEAFMAANPAWRRQASFPVTTLRLFSLEALPALKASDIRISQSADNVRYRPVGGRPRVSVRKVRRPHRRWAPDGIHPEAGVGPCWCLEIAGLRITQPFVALEAPGSDATLLNRQFALVEAVAEDGTEAPFLVGTAVHATIAGPKVGAAGTPRRYAFSSAMGGWLTQDEPVTALRRWSLRNLGLALVEPETLPGLLEPAHPLAAKVWLDRIDFCLRQGVDGVSLRTLRHHNGCPSWTQYAFAPCVRERFQALHGRPVTASEEDLERVRGIRGEAFGQFLTEASRRVKGQGKRFIFQVEVVGGALDAVDSRMGMRFDLQRWIGQGLFDELHVKINSGRTPWVRGVLLPFARQHGVPVHLITANASSGYGHADYRINERLVSDAVGLGYDGVNFYESANLYELTEGGVIQSRALGEACIRRAAALAHAARERR